MEARPSWMYFGTLIMYRQPRWDAALGGQASKSRHAVLLEMLRTLVALEITVVSFHRAGAQDVVGFRWRGT